MTIKSDLISLLGTKIGHFVKFESQGFVPTQMLSIKFEKGTS